MSSVSRKPTRRWVWFISLAGLTLILLASWLYTGRYGHTPPFRDGTGAQIQGSVAEIRRVRLGGIEQSVVIRGRNAKAPILIWLHGGPGQDETGMWRFHNAVLEDHFLVVYWTQRGTGRSYDSTIPLSSMRISQFVTDLDQLIALLKSRFHQRQVTLAGHSWGTIIGVAYTQAHPENVAAYLGVGQVVNAAEGERRSYQFTIDEARRRENKAAIAELTAIGPPPYAMHKLLKQRGWLNEFGGAWHTPTTMPELLWTSFKASEMTVYDGLKFMPGQNFSGDALASENAKVDWLNTATHFQMPVFIAAGRFDRNTDADLQYLYFEKIDAPYKRFKWFENSAHSPPFEEPAVFNAFIVNEVLPVVIARNAAR